MKSIWTGAIGFGLVNIPIKMYSAVQADELDLDMLDKKDHANIKFKRVNEHTGKEVAWDNIVKGYKVDERYVVLTDEDFEKASPEKSKIIEIEAFVDESAIDSIYYETPYYLEPQKSSAKAYSLLRDALKKTGKAGLGLFVMRTKESLCIIKPLDEVLVVNRIRFLDEIRSFDDLNLPAASAKPAEIKMAIELINQLTTDFDISKYKNTYTEALLKLIKAKARGKKVAAPHLKVVHSASRDLMSQLKASLNTKSRKAS
ncbi:MAG TPA: Ku protein [Panacibacter sp.]|nr:Ku protein [Panacibacter sp.]HNP46466.1 Ku protein [Panacibacter sp.]